jgi:hypothetical protein
MPDDIFSPFPHGSSVAPGSAEVIYLKRALFVLRGQFFDPIANADVPLPPHRWAIAHSETVFAESATSDADGIATIFEPDKTGAPPDGEWDLYLIPIFDGRPDSDLYATQKEAWIDIEKKKWVPNDLIGEGSHRHLAKEKLLRVPLWSTKRKAASGGGFVDTFPHSGTFAQTGVLKTTELKPHGSREAPWKMQVDHGWLRTHVQFHYYDPIAKADKTVPQGVLLMARTDLITVVGGSSVLLPNGSLYMVSAGVKDNLATLYYQFELPRNPWFQYSDGAMSVTDLKKHLDYERIGTHYLLPDQWGGPTHEAWIGPGAANAEHRKPFTEIRLEGTTSAKPVCFHLDDMIFASFKREPLFVDKAGKTTFPSSRCCVLDNFMGILKQEKMDNKPMPWSTLVIDRYPLRGEEAFHVPGQGFEKMTRAIDYDGRLFTTVEDRVRGLVGLDAFVGARAARISHSSNMRDSELHLLDTRWLRYTHDGVSAKLAHLLVYLPCFVVAPVEDRKNNQKNAAETLGVPRAEQLLFDSALRWDQKHPAHPDAKPPLKDYVIFSASGLTADKTAIKVRHHFGAGKNPTRIGTDGQPSTDKPLIIEVHPQAGRANAPSGKIHLYLKFADVHPLPTDPHSEVPGTFDFEPRGGTRPDRLDSVEGQDHTIAHELGHSMGLPDEYAEKVASPKTIKAEIPAFQALPRPYHLDIVSMMKANMVPRIRHEWNAATKLVDAAEAAGFRKDHWTVTEKPFVVQYLGGGKKLRYALPDGVLKFGDRPQYWGQHDDRVALCDVHLFLAGDDESTRGQMITPPDAGILATPFDGVIVVNPKFWFTFDSSISDTDDRWEFLYEEFARDFVHREHCPKFFIESAGGVGLHRVVVVFQPRFEFGPSPSKIDKTKLEVVTNADIEVRVRGSGTPRVRTATGKPHVLAVRKGDVGKFLMRYALDPTQAVFDDRNNEDLQPKELHPVNAWFAKLVGRTTTLRAL